MYYNTLHNTATKSNTNIQNDFETLQNKYKWPVFIYRFSNHWPPKVLYNIASHSPLTHRRRSQPCKATASSSGAVRVRCLAQGHLNTQLGGAGD